MDRWEEAPWAKHNRQVLDAIDRLPTRQLYGAAWQQNLKELDKKLKDWNGVNITADDNGIHII
jgi:hypothetical protein